MTRYFAILRSWSGRDSPALYAEKPIVNRKMLDDQEVVCGPYAVPKRLEGCSLGDLAVLARAGKLTERKSGTP